MLGKDCGILVRLSFLRAEGSRPFQPTVDTLLVLVVQKMIGEILTQNKCQEVRLNPQTLERSEQDSNA